MTNEPTKYFIAWMEADNQGKPGMPYLAAREVYNYRVFRADRNEYKSAPITEAMTYKEAEAKIKEIYLITEGVRYE